MYTRCLVCATPFEVNEELANLPHGTRLAFDPARGRLSAVCRSRRMFRAGALQVVRVREAKLTEEAWRRYGRALTTRKRKWVSSPSPGLWRPARLSLAVGRPGE